MTVHEFAKVEPSAYHTNVASHPVIVHCHRCESRLGIGRNTVYADLKGKPFQDYYCETCKRDLEGVSP